MALRHLLGDPQRELRERRVLGQRLEAALHAGDVHVVEQGARFGVDHLRLVRSRVRELNRLFIRRRRGQRSQRDERREKRSDSVHTKIFGSQGVRL